jgi:hypothetical protein
MAKVNVAPEQTLLARSKLQTACLILPGLYNDIRTPRDFAPSPHHPFDISKGSAYPPSMRYTAIFVVLAATALRSYTAWAWPQTSCPAGQSCAIYLVP